MASKYYVDTAIWRDLHENRKDKSKHLGELAFESFKKIRANKEKVVYSDFVVAELSHAYDKQTIDKLFKGASELLEKVEINEEQLKEAADLSKELKIPLGDAVHGVLARDNKAIMVTRDRHFRKQKIKSLSKSQKT